MNVQHRPSEIEKKFHGVKMMNERQKQRYDLEERLLEFSVRIIKIVEQLPNNRMIY